MQSCMVGGLGAQTLSYLRSHVFGACKRAGVVCTWELALLSVLQDAILDPSRGACWGEEVLSGSS